MELTSEQIEKRRATSRQKYSKDKPRHVRYAVENYTKKTYGITLKRKEELIKLQHGKCAICGTDNPGNSRGWQVEHDHETGKIRGIVCHPCNLTLGNAKEDISRLKRCLAYIRFHKRKIYFPSSFLWQGIYPQGGIERELVKKESGRYEKI